MSLQAQDEKIAVLKDEIQNSLRRLQEKENECREHLKSIQSLNNRIQQLQSTTKEESNAVRALEKRSESQIKERNETLMAIEKSLIDALKAIGIPTTVRFAI
jgi:hypothetical protein